MGVCSDSKSNEDRNVDEWEIEGGFKAWEIMMIDEEELKKYLEDRLKDETAAIELLKNDLGMSISAREAYLNVLNYLNEEKNNECN